MKLDSIIKYTAAALLTSAVLFGCTPVDELEKQKDTFRGKTEFGIYEAGNDVFVYTEDGCQYSVSSTNKTARVQKDDTGNGYFQLKIDGTIAGGNDITAGVLVRKISAEGLVPGNSVTVELTVLKVDSEKAWLWDAEHQRGFLIPMI